MDAIFGLCAKDFAIVVCDTTVNRSIFSLKHDEDKIMQINKYKLLAAAGE